MASPREASIFRSERHARLSRHEHELGAWTRAYRSPDVRRRIERDPARWCDIAYDAGYADQSHLSREFQEFAGITPTEFVARLIPQGGVSQGRISNVR